MDVDAQLRAEAAAVRRASRKFEAAVSQDPGTWGGASAVILRRLQTEPITGMGRVVYSSNAVFVVEFDGPDLHRRDEPLRAIYKPARGERPLWDFPRRTLHLREVAAFVVSAALGDAVVPPTVPRNGPYGPGSMQLFIHSGTGLTSAAAATFDDQLRAVAALDVLINNADRKRAHVLLGEDGQLRGIDNALSFLPYPRQRTVLIELGGQALPEPVAARVRSLAADAARRSSLLGTLGGLLDHDEVGAFETRLDDLATDPVYPVLDAWEGRPFEWW